MRRAQPRPVPRRRPLFCGPIRVSGDLLVAASYRPYVLKTVSTKVLLRVLVRRLPTLLRTRHLVNEQDEHQYQLQAALRLRLAFRVLVRLPTRARVRPTRDSKNDAGLFLIHHLTNAAREKNRMARFTRLRHPTVNGTITRLVRGTYRHSFRRTTTRANRGVCALCGFLTISNTLKSGTNVGKLLLTNLTSIKFLRGIMVHARVCSIFG